MCEKRIVRLTRGCKKTRLREARRIQRLQQQSVPVNLNIRPAPYYPLLLDKGTQKRVLLEIALRTVSLVQRNKLIQEKIVALRKETSDFMNNAAQSPEHEQRCTKHVQIYSHLLRQTQQLQLQHKPLIDCIRFPQMLQPKPR